MSLVTDILFPISNLWSHGGGDQTSFTGQGNTYKSGDVATEGVGGKQDSLTQMLRSMSNLTGTAGKTALGEGESVFGKGVDSFKQPQDFWSKLLGGNRESMAQQMNPEVSSIVSQYDAGRKAMSEFGARGGGKNSTLAELPTKQTGDITKMFQTMRPEAAKQLTGIAQVLASLGLSQEQIAASLFSLTNQNLLGRKGLNVQESSANKQLALGAAKTAVDALI